MSMFYVDPNNKNIKNRFSPSRYFEFNEGGYSPLNSYFFQQLLLLPSQGEYVIDANPQRPDNISRDIYGTPIHQFNLLYYNGMTHPDEMEFRLVIKYPSQADLERLYTQTSSREITTR